MMYSVRVPDGVFAGQSFVANCGGSHVRVEVPPGAGPGSVLTVDAGQPNVATGIPVAHQPVPAYTQQYATGLGMGSLKPAGEEEEEEDAQAAKVSDADAAAAEGRPERWQSFCGGLVRAFPLSICALIVALVLCVVGTALAELNRLHEADTLYELSTCCAAPTNTSCARFVGYYGGAGSACPAGAAPAQSQTVSMEQNDLALITGRDYGLVVYVSTLATVSLDYLLVDGAASQVLAPTSVDLEPASTGRRLLASDGEGRHAVPGRRLLKGGTSGGGSSSSSSGGSSASSYRSTQPGASGTQVRAQSTTYRRPVSGTSSSSASSFRSSAVRQPTGLYSGGAIRGGAFLGTTYRRRHAADSTSRDGRDDETIASEDLDRCGPPAASRLRACALPDAWPTPAATRWNGRPSPRTASAATRWPWSPTPWPSHPVRPATRATRQSSSSPSSRR